MKRGKGTKILCGVGIAAAALYCVNRLAFLLSTRKNILQGGDQSSFSWRFGNIYYTKKGKGDPILLLHGMETGSSAHEWKSMMGTLAESRTVYAIDLPGYGRSDKERMLYTNYLYVDAVTAFVKKVIGTKTDIVTSGASSSIAVMAAASNPDLFGSLVMITPESPDEMIKSPRPSQIALSKLMMLPLVVSIAYEINRWVGKTDNAFTRILTAPGLWMQNFTTNEPDDSMIEVAILAVQQVLPEQEGSDAW
jgi:pimeloyl-ACP methyl ester carboxylesterase